MSNNHPISQVGLSDDSNVTFLIRWRGRQEGPYTAAVIEAKLAANQIGLLHEIAHNGQWVGHSSPQIITCHGQCLSNRKFFLRIFVLSRQPADSVLARRHEAKPRLCFCRSHQFAVMLEDHLRAIARFQRHLRDVLNVRHAVADE